MKYMMPPPPNATGSLQDQMVKYRNYLYQMNELLNVAMNSIDEANFAPQTVKVITKDSSEEARKSMEQQAETLKSLIIKTADIVQSEIDEISTTLNTTYMAKSEFGTYLMQEEAYIAATADGVVQNYDYQDQIDAANGEIADFETFRQRVTARIKSGLIRYDGVRPIYGVAIAQEITDEEFDDEHVVDPSKLIAALTAERLSFYLNGAEVAYMSNSKLYITQAEVTTRLKFGNYVFEPQADGSMALIYDAGGGVLGAGYIPGIITDAENDGTGQSAE